MSEQGDRDELQAWHAWLRADAKAKKAWGLYVAALVDDEAAYKTNGMALSIWGPARDAERAAKRALDKAHTAWFALDRGLYSPTKKGHNE